jgi:hypothetical protein
VSVREDVLSAFKVWGLGVEINKLEMAAVTVGVVVTPAVELASPPPPPQAVKTTASTKPIAVFNIDIVNALFMP